MSRSEDEKHKSLKRPNGIKLEGIKRNEGYFIEPGRSPSLKQSKHNKRSNCYDQVLGTSEDKKCFDNIYIRNDATDVYFDTSLNIDPSHKSYLNEHKLPEVIVNDKEKFFHADSVVQSNSSKKERITEISISQTKNSITIELEKDSVYEKVKTQTNAVEKLWN